MSTYLHCIWLSTKASLGSVVLSAVGCSCCCCTSLFGVVDVTVEVDVDVEVDVEVVEFSSITLTMSSIGELVGKRRAILLDN